MCALGAFPRYGSRTSLVFALFLASVLHIASFAQATVPRYAIVVDAGSTGTRAFVFQEHNFDEDDRVIQSIPCGKERMGLSAFAANHSAVTTLFTTLLSNAATIIPPMYHRSTSLYVRGTAGMRLLDKRSHDALWIAVVKQLRRDPSIPFHIDRKNFGTISGHEEAFYAVLASNYIAGSIDGNLRLVSGASLIGALDMGGSSNQLVIYNGSDPKARVENSHFWSHSWLRYGAEMVRERLLQHLYETHVHRAAATPGSTASASSGDGVGSAPEVVAVVEEEVVMLENPCGYAGHFDAYTDRYVFAGTGRPNECQRLIERIIWADSVSPVGVPEGELLGEDVTAEGVLEFPSSAEIAEAAGAALQFSCAQGPCAIDEIVHPSVKGHQFYAMGAYYYALDCVRLIGPEPLPHWPNPTLAELRTATEKFCAMPWSAVKERYDGIQEAQYTYSSQLPYRCMEALYMITLLEKGFGFDPHSRSITLALEVKGQEVEWTLGYVLAQVDFSSSALDGNPPADALSPRDLFPQLAMSLDAAKRSQDMLALYSQTLVAVVDQLEKSAQQMLDGVQTLKVQYESVVKQFLGE